MINVTPYLYFRYRGNLPQTSAAWVNGEICFLNADKILHKIQHFYSEALVSRQNPSAKIIATPYFYFRYRGNPPQSMWISAVPEVEITLVATMYSCGVHVLWWKIVIDIRLSVLCSFGSTVSACQFSLSVERARRSFVWRKKRSLDCVKVHELGFQIMLVHCDRRLKAIQDAGKQSSR